MNVMLPTVDPAQRTLAPPNSLGRPRKLTHLEQLEAESIHIVREAYSESENPVLLYSIGKDSSVLLHLAMKASYPAKLPFPLLHIDTTWKFRDMIAFRDRRTGELGLRLIVHVNQHGLVRGIGPISHGSNLHTDIMKTQALRQALDHHGFDVALGGARRDEERSRQGTRVLSSQCATPLGSDTAARRAVAPLQRPQAERRKHPRVSALKLDRTTFGSTSIRNKSPLSRSISRRCARWFAAAGPWSWSTTTVSRSNQASSQRSGLSDSGRSVVTR